MIRKFLLSLMLFLIVLTPVMAVEFIVPRLSPLPVSIDKQKLSLNGEWAFNSTPGNDFWKRENTEKWSAIQVPGEWVMQGFEVKEGSAAGYCRTFKLPLAWKGQRIKLRCNAIYSDSKIYINGQEAGSHLGGFTAFEMDVTELVKFGKENRIAVSVASESVADATSNGSNYAVHPLGGITRDIFLFALPEVNFSMFHISTSFDSVYTDAVLRAEVAVTNETMSAASGLNLEFILKDAQGRIIPLKSSSCSLSDIAATKTQYQTLSFDIPNPTKWDNEHPYLYTLTCQLKNKQRVISSTVRRVGFRQIEVRGNQMFVNNMPIKLRGVCRHEVMPLRGRSVSDDMWRRDVELFRRGNVNYIRTSHYPPDEALMEACDELGMFVELEAPFCWAHQAKVPQDKHYDVLINQHVEMVNLNRSHPSILMWSVGNESNMFKEYFSEASEVIKQIDPTRPRIFSQWEPNADGGALEVTNHHYPGPGGPDKYRKHNRPVVFDEFCHLNAYNRLELAADPGLRNMWGVLLDAMWRDMYHSQGVLGGAIWAGIDDTFFLPGEKAVGYGTWGPVDGWRREKPEYWGMKKAFSPVKIMLKGNMTADGKIYFGVENRHIFSNLSECQLIWSAQGKQGTVRVDLAPRCEGEFEIRLPEALRRIEILEITVTGVRGFVVDQYKFRVLPEIVKPLAREDVRGLIYDESGEVVDIRTAGIHYMINKRNGLLSAESNGREILSNAPLLMVLPLNDQGEGIQMTGKDQNFTPYNPVCRNWTAQSVTCLAVEQEVVRVEVRGSYKEAQGVLEYSFYPNGEIKVAYDFTMLCDVSPRQVGLVFSLVPSFTELKWERKGYWSVYPDDHIGALEGRAKAFDAQLPVSGLAGPAKTPAVAWSFDQTAAGSNMFRSTKENIYSASLSEDAGCEISVLSDARQHVRAWIEEGGIRLLVADYNNAGNDTYLTSHAQNGYKPLRKGDKVEGVVRLVIR